MARADFPYELVFLECRPTCGTRDYEYGARRRPGVWPIRISTEPLFALLHGRGISRLQYFFPAEEGVDTMNVLTYLCSARLNW